MLSISELEVSFWSPNQLKVLRRIELALAEKESFGLVGESGCGKSMLALAILGLLPKNAQITKGWISFEGQNLTQLNEQEYTKVRGKKIGFIFQDPLTGLNPVFTAGEQVSEVLIKHLGLSSREAKVRTLELFTLVGFNEPKRVYASYPHQLSGGMRQRVIIAMAICCQPKLLIADEPTTALDVTTQAQILDLLKALKAQQARTTLFISHNLSLVADFCQRIAVMYLGQIVEQAKTEVLLAQPLHPYTQGLINSIPDWEQTRPLRPIPGNVPFLRNIPAGCSFHPRCEQKMDICTCQEPPWLEVGDETKVRCWLYA